MQALLAKIALAFFLLFASWLTGYNNGESHQKTIYVSQQVKADAKVVTKNDQMQTASDKEAQVQIVYKDRIVTKYQQVIKEVVKYENTKEGSTNLDSEFVRLHNIAATDSEVQATQPTSGVDSTDVAAETTITTGQALNTITDNYKSFYDCKAKLDGWQRFYNDLQKTINEK